MISHHPGDSPPPQQTSIGEMLASRHNLMTPMLKAYFGATYAIERYSKREGSLYIRHSSIFQQITDQPILHATLSIETRHLPADLIERLENSKQLFGQLLIDYGLKTEIAELNPFTYFEDEEKDEEKGGQKSEPCFGRTLTILEIGHPPHNEKRPLAFIKEHLVNEQALQTAHRAALNNLNNTP